MRFVRAAPPAVRVPRRRFSGGPGAARGRGIEGPLPVAILADGRALARPGQAEVAAALGVQASIGPERVDVAVIGAGPAGLAAAVYGASEGLSVTVIESTAIGGQASSSPMMRNYLGFPAGVTGGELTARAYQQAVTFGVKFVFGRTATALRIEGEDRIVTLDDGAELRAADVVVATGVSYRRMGIARLECSSAGACSTARGPARHAPSTASTCTSSAARTLPGRRRSIWRAMRPGDRARSRRDRLSTRCRTT